jgi:hypothetical protein
MLPYLITPFVPSCPLKVKMFWDAGDLQSARAALLRRRPRITLSNFAGNWKLLKALADDLFGSFQPHLSF